MSLQSTFPSEIPDQTRESGEAILAKNDVCYFLGNHIEEFLSEADFAEMYLSTGRPGVHSLIPAMVTVLQYLEKYPDRRASQQAVKRIDWKYAFHQTLIGMGFHYSDLCNFRKRLLENDASNLVFDKLIQHLLKVGWLKSGGKQRTDATHILGEVKRLSLLEVTSSGTRAVGVCRPLRIPRLGGLSLSLGVTTGTDSITP